MDLTRRVSRSQANRRRLSALCAIGAATWVAACAPEASDEQTGETSTPTATEEASGSSDAQLAVVEETVSGSVEVSNAQSTAAEPLSPLEAGRAFLASNSTREGVITTDSGLQYEVLASGDGESPGRRDVVRTHYHGMLVDGRVFDSSLRGEPLEFPVNRVISGWTEALQLMRVGDKWRLYIPPELAYGERGARGSIIGPNETLIFEVELLAVKPTEAFTITTELGAFGCIDLKDGMVVVHAIQASANGVSADERKAIIDESGLGKVFADGKCVWFENEERVKPIGGPNSVWGGEPLTAIDWFLVRRDDEGTVTTPDSPSKEYWLLASDLDPAGVAEW